MNLQELRNLLSIINGEDPTGVRIHLVLKATEYNPNEQIYEADISDELATEFREIFEDIVNRTFFLDEDLILTNISEANELVNSAFFYDLDEFPSSLNVLNDFQPMENYDAFSFSDNDIELTKSLLITLGNGESYFTIYKHVFPVSILRQNRVLGLIPSGDRFEKLSSNILQVNTSIDFLFADDKLIVKNLKTFTSSYGYKEIVKRQARAKIELIDQLGLIENIEELTNFMDNVKYAKRVLKINPNSPVLHLAKDHIVNFISQHDKISGRVRLNDNEDMVLLDTDVSKIIIIGILNDDYLKSNLTELDYESHRKEELIAEDED